MHRQPLKVSIESLKDRRWILLPGTLCTEEVFNEFLNLAGVANDNRYPVSLKYAHVDDYLPLLTKLIRPGDVVCGFSLGAIVAAHLADRFDASALLLFGLNPFADDPAKAAGRKSLAASVRAEGGRAALGSRLPPILGRSHDLTKEMILSMADSTANFIEEQTALALNRPGAMTALAAARCPILLITGSEDDSAPFMAAQAASEVAKDGCAVVVEGLGHYALIEDPLLCYTTLERQGQL